MLYNTWQVCMCVCGGGQAHVWLGLLRGKYGHTHTLLILDLNTVAIIRSTA